MPHLQLLACTAVLAVLGLQTECGLPRTHTCAGRAREVHRAAAPRRHLAPQPAAHLSRLLLAAERQGAWQEMVEGQWGRRLAGR